MTFGGATFHRAPMEFVRELVRQEKKERNIIICSNPFSPPFLTSEGSFPDAKKSFVRGMMGILKFIAPSSVGEAKSAPESNPATVYD